MQHLRMTTFLAATAALLGLAISAIAADIPKEAVKLTPAELQWKPGRVTPSPEVAFVLGDDSKPGLYVFRVRFPPNFKLEAHGHPDDRRYTILSGTWYIGWGKKFDESKLIALPAGSFYTEPANIPHFVATKDEGAIIEISGTGPTGQIWVDPAHAPKKK